jgi:hypothetical protein
VVTADPLGSAAQAETDANAYTDSLFGPLDVRVTDLETAFTEGLPLVTASGTDTYTGTLTGFTVGAGKTIAVKIPNANTGAATFNLNSSSAKAIKKTGGTEDVAAGDLKAGGVYIFHDDGTNWQVIGVGGGGGGGGGPAIAEVYPNIAALLADQTNQEENAFYWVEDATTDTTVDAGWAIYRKLAASTADISDYVKVQEQEGLEIVATPDWDDTTKGKVERAIQAEAETAAEVLEANRNNDVGISPRGFRWSFDAVWAWIKTQAQTITAAWTFNDVLLENQKAASTKKNGVLIDDTGKITKVAWVEHDTTNQKITSSGVDDLEATVQAEWKNDSGTAIMQILNGLKVVFGGTSSLLEVQSGITDGNAGIQFLQAFDIAYRLKDETSFDYIKLKSSTSGIGRAVTVSQKQVNDYSQGFATIRNQYKLTLPNTTAGVSHIVGSIAVPSGYGLAIHVHNAFAYATNGNANGCEPFSAIGHNVAGTTSGSSTAPTALRITATTGDFSVVWNNTTDTADLTFTNETGTGRQYDVLFDVSYILYPIPV